MSGGAWYFAVVPLAWGALIWLFRGDKDDAFGAGSLVFFLGLLWPLLVMAVVICAFAALFGKAIAAPDDAGGAS